MVLSSLTSIVPPLPPVPSTVTDTLAVAVVVGVKLKPSGAVTASEFLVTENWRFVSTQSSSTTGAPAPPAAVFL